MGHHKLDSRVSIPLLGLMKGLNKIKSMESIPHKENSIDYHYKVTKRIISLDWEHHEMQAMMKRESLLPPSGSKYPGRML